MLDYWKIEIEPIFLADRIIGGLEQRQHQRYRPSLSLKQMIFALQGLTVYIIYKNIGLLAEVWNNLLLTVRHSFAYAGFTVVLCMCVVWWALKQQRLRHRSYWKPRNSHLDVIFWHNCSVSFSTLYLLLAVFTFDGLAQFGLRYDQLSLKKSYIESHRISHRVKQDKLIVVHYFFFYLYVTFLNVWWIA